MGIKVVLFGVGRIVQRHVLPNLADCPDCDITAVCDTSETILKEVSSQLDLSPKQIFTDWKALLKKADFDAAIISTPNFLHYDMVCSCLNENKHVLVSKPMAITLEEANKIVELASDANTFLMVEQTQRFDPVHEVAKDLIDSGKIGKIKTLKARLGHAGPEYWTDGKPGWIVDKQLSGGGTLMDSGAHIIDLIRWFKGGEIKSIICSLSNIEKDFEVEDNAAGVVIFDDGTLGVIECSWTTRPYEVVTKIYGEKGTIETCVTNAGSKVVLTLCKEHPEDPNCIESIEEIPVPAKSKYKSPFHYFIDCIKNGKEPFVTGIDGLKTLEVILAGYKSAEEGTEVGVQQ